ncbi:EF-hand domain-containing family member B [Sciurus carolinensis]|uniref:EF-hand domain-containing family member B n=1 Tax=Sciurus carolinensis TaxID=30640 RepID=A0AA41NJE8_SCICA|nr:EF-hand domain-containing family member B [Sciurus carolinensis]
MCSFVRVGSPKVLETSLDPGTAFPSELSACREMRASGGKSPPNLEVRFTQEGKDDLGDRRIFPGTKPSVELGLQTGLGKEDSLWWKNPLINKYKERMALPVGKGLEMRLGSQTISRNPMERGNLGVNRVCASLGKPCPWVLPVRVGLENECFPARYLHGRTMQPPLGMVCSSSQPAGSQRGPVARGSEGIEAVVGKQPALGMVARQEQDKESTCVVLKPSTQMEAPVEVDIGLPQTEEPDETKNLEPQMGLVIEPPQNQFIQQPEEKKETRNIEPGVEPPDHIRPIYSGKFFDRMPCWPSLITPPEAKKFFNYRYPPPGAERVFYGRANDPPVAPHLTHGIKSKITVTASSLINPQPITTFQQKMKDKKESIYFSNQRAPLGKSHDQKPGLPEGLDIINTTFGTAIIRELSARDVVNPPKSFEEVFKEGEEGHDLYIVSHNDYYAGVGDLIHNRPSGECLRGKDRERALIAAVRHHLKKFNYQNFDSLLAAFRHYDKASNGMIDKAELQEACDQANLHLDEKLLDELFDYCDVDNDGLINFLEFANFLNWKETMVLKDYEEKVIIKGRKPDCANPAEANLEESEPTLLIKPEDIVFKEPGSSEKTVRTLLRPSDKVSNHYKTTSSEINAVVGAVPSICYPIFGVPTVRCDIPAPRIRRISDRTNYGEEGNAYSLLHPTIFAQKGVFERDFFKTRSKEEIAEILCNIGVKLSEEEFENVWTLASKKHHRGEVCVENIRNVLDELQHADRIKCKTTM